MEGVDDYHACNGGTAALLACANWVESEAWDGRWAVCVCTDVSDAPAQYPFMNGAAAVAMLVGADAPLALEGRRHTHMAHEWDFYKPVGWPSMGPIVDGPGSIEVYQRCLGSCQAALARVSRARLSRSTPGDSRESRGDASFAKRGPRGPRGGSVSTVAEGHFPLPTLPSGTMVGAWSRRYATLNAVAPFTVVMSSWI